MRKEIPLGITLVVGILVLLSSLTTGPIPGLSISFNDVFKLHISPWMVIVSAFALGLASVNLFLVHMRRITGKRQNWAYSIVLLVTMAIFGGLRSYVEIVPTNTVAVSAYSRIFTYILSPLMAGQWAFLGFYVASASYRAFRARNLDASILLISAVLVMLGAAPVGAVIWDKFPAIQQWFLNVPNMTGQRGIIIGSAIGMFTTGLRVLVGMERGYLGGDSA
jgi:uncharacterized membrane protein